MALQYYIEMSNGVTCTEGYLKVVTVTLDQQRNTARVLVGVYLSQEARQEGKTCLKYIPVTVTGDDFTTYFSDLALKAAGISPVASAYTYMKTLPQFASATDC
jgi:predicted acetyltransferase